MSPQDFANNHVTNTADLAREEASVALVDTSAQLRDVTRSLISAGRVEDALLLLLRGVVQFPTSTWPFEETLSIARLRGDWDLAAVHSALLRSLNPNLLIAYDAGVFALRQLDRQSDAEALLLEAVERFPQEERLIIDAVWTAQSKGNWPEAIRRAAQLRMRFPMNMSGYAVAANALRELRRFDEADQVLCDAGEQFPNDEWRLAEAAWVASNRKDWNEALRRAEDLRNRAPKHPAGFMIGSHALRHLGRFDEADSVLAEASATFPQAEWVLHEAAWVSYNKLDWPEALSRAERLQLHFPDNKSGYMIRPNALLALQRIQEAEVVINKAISRFPEDRTFLVDLINLTQLHGGLDRAEGLVKELMARYPKFDWSYAMYARIAQSRGEFEDADRRWLAATSEFPDSPEILLQYVLSKQAPFNDRNKDWPATWARFEVLHERFPNFVEGWRMHIQMLCQTGAIVLAEDLASECIRRMPDAATIAIEHARVAAGRGASAVFLRRMELAVERFPDDPNILQEYAQALSDLGQFDAADDVIRGVLGRFRPTVLILASYAANAAKKGDLGEALNRWHDAGRCFPNNSDITRGIFETQLALSERNEIVPLSDSTNQQEFSDVVGRSPGEILSRFESLGGTGQGCEFGFVQRHAGVEPLGLLRWSQMLYDGLLSALETEFEGTGTPEQTILDFYEQANQEEKEYAINDCRFGMRMHTFVKRREVPWDQMLSKSCRRLQFLRRKLIEDLGAGEKIFVFKLSDRILSVQELDKLRRAMAAYGKNTLLYVRFADVAHPTGTVVRLNDGLLIGYISGFSISASGEPRRPDIPSWISICAEALRLTQESKSE